MITYLQKDVDDFNELNEKTYIIRLDNGTNVDMHLTLDMFKAAHNSKPYKHLKDKHIKKRLNLMREFYMDKLIRDT